MAATTAAANLPGGLAPEALAALLRTMMRIRRFEERIVEEYGRQEMKTPVHLCIGQEAVCAGVCAALGDGDYLFSNHRGHGHCIARGASPRDLYAEFYGKEAGCSRGRGGSMHPVAPQLGILGTSAIVAGGVPHAVGAAWAAKMRGEDRLAVTFFGDGAADQGIFAESLSWASLKALPVIFVCENNLYATNSPLSARQPNEDVHRRGEPYGVPGWCLDGNDVVAVHRAAREAVRRARAGEGPTLLECKTYRWKGHVGPDCDHEKGCRPKAELLSWMETCPVEAFRRRLVEAGVVTEADVGAWAEAIADEMEQALQYGKSCPDPDPSALTRHVYCEEA